MKNLKDIALVAMKASLCAFGAFILTGCSNDNVPEVLPETDETVSTPALTVYIPADMNTGSYTTSRATQNVSSSEGAISDLWLVACDGVSAPVVVDLFGTYAGDTEVEDFSGTKPAVTYKTYTVTVDDLDGGAYRFYVLANMLGYLKDEDKKSGKPSFADEGAVKSLALEFGEYTSTSAQNYLMRQDSKGNYYLPMACLPSEMKTTKDGQPVGEANNSLITYNNYAEGSALFADLTLLCAKIRYTVLFDNEGPKTKNDRDVVVGGFSEDFYSNAVDFQKATLSNVRNTTDLHSGTIEATSATYFDTFDCIRFHRAAYPTQANNTTGYLDIKGLSEDAHAPADLGVLSTFGADDNKRAWQGWLYVPENKDELKKTTISLLPEDGSNVKTANCKFELNPERGHFYDVVAKLVNPEFYIYDITVYVRVNPWDYKGSAPTEW
ncbi:MAG: hypothetical protein J1F16_09120 [Muribaculaceae bacterium]|nr:hypothetical protein [Muribaculaceae bacterium]